MTDANLSRREFLKMLGFGAVVAAGGVFTNFIPQAISSREANAQSLGSWALGPTLPFPTVHGAVLKTGKIMTTPGSGWQIIDKLGPYHVSIIDVEAGTRFDSTVPDDVFCCGFNQLGNGNILITGGTISYADGPDGKYHGGKFAYEFDVDTTTWNKLSDMAHGRWYPSQMTLPGGKAFIMTGLDEYGTENDLTEIYDPVSKTFSIKYDSTSSKTYCVGWDSSLPGAGSPCYGGPGQGTNPDFSFYVRTMLMPSGLVFVAGMRQTLRTWNPATGEWKWGGNSIAPGRTYGTAALLPLENTLAEKGRVLMTGGQVNGGLTTQNSAEVVTFDADGSPNASQSVPSMTYARMYQDPVMLPTGHVVIFGGTSGSNVNSVLYPEMFDPVTETWTVLPPASVGRFYHSVSLLLPDGRVWVSSGTPNMYLFEGRTEFFSPHYLFAGARPTISGEPTFQRINNDPYSGTITIPTPDGLDISSVNLVRLGNATHHFDYESRLLWLASSSVSFVSKSGSDVVVNAPLNANLAPPGYYMIHVLNGAGVPSAAKIIQIGSAEITGPDTTPPSVGITSPSSRSPIIGPSSGVPITIAGTAVDPSSGVKSVKIQIDSGLEIPASSTLNNYEMWEASTTVLTPGPHKIKATATDNADNVSSVEIPITVFFS